MTRKSNDEIKEELNISDDPGKDRHQSSSSDSGDHHHHHHSRRGHLAHDFEPVDDDAINKDLQNVIAAYWKDRQKPGFVGYKDNQEDEEEEVRVENDVDVSFLKNPKGMKSARTEAEIPTNVQKKMEEKPAEPEGTKEIIETLTVPAESKASEVKADIADNPPVFKISPEKLTKARETAAKPEEAKEPEAAKAPVEAPAECQPDDKPDPENISGTEPEKPVKPDNSKPETPQKPDNKAPVKKRKKKKKKKGPARILKWIFTFLLLLVIGGTVTLGIMRYVGWKNSNRTNDSGEDISTADGAITEDGGKTVVYKGVTYVYNEELSTILFIGVDKEKYEENGVSGEAGQADTVILTVVNQKTGETRMIPLSRSTIVAIDQYNADGSYWKQDNLQLAVSFAYGDNIDENCKNVAKAVSRILYGMPVHRYVTMDLSAIPKLNDAVGGVTVNCLEDMTDCDESWKEGAEITLHGKEAETYVRHRKTTISDESQDNNAPRMERQKQYLNNFIQTLLTGMKGDITVPLRLYRDVGDDIYSDVTTSEIVYYTSMVVSKGFNNSILSVKGSVKHGKFTEFYPDEEELYQLILDTFYERQ